MWPAVSMCYASVSLVLCRVRACVGKNLTPGDTQFTHRSVKGCRSQCSSRVTERRLLAPQRWASTVRVLRRVLGESLDISGLGVHNCRFTISTCIPPEIYARLFLRITIHTWGGDSYVTDDGDDSAEMGSWQGGWLEGG